VADNANLGLDIAAGDGESAPVARIVVRFARGYTRDGDPTLTLDCPTLGALEREVARLGEEMNAALRAAAERLPGGTTSEAKAGPAQEAAPATSSARPRLHSELRVAEVMTREVRTLGRNDPVSVAEELMRVGRFRHAVVLEEDGTLAGVLSQRDIMLNPLTWQLGRGLRAHQHVLETIHAKDLMQANVTTIAPGAPLAEAASLMKDAKIGCLPVMDGPKLVGIVTESDLLGLLLG
jgi:acetoin utilization protein AcuB